MRPRPLILAFLVTLALGATVESGALCLRVLDEGPGIPDYALPRLFERFYSLPRPDTGRKSSGLGLSFIREVARLHGGSVEVANRQGSAGARAELKLPLDAARASLRPRPSGDAAEGEASGS